MKKLGIIIIFLIFSGITVIFGSTTGKIVGVVTDAENGEPLIGVNMFLEGTTLGAATDLDGYFIILNVPPGNYQLRADYVGYAPAIVGNVSVKIDLTTEIAARTVYF